MANREHLDLLKQGSAAWNAWRAQHEEVRPDLGATDLREANLSFANLNNANFSGADLKGARNITAEELEKQAKSLKDAILPDGSKHP